MAFSATTEWDVRTTGSDTNGGGFNTAAAGTDYSKQDAAQVTYTDLVVDGATNTKCTSAAFPFTSAHVGNIINITSGTGFTVQRVQVVSVAGVAATCDKSLGTLGSTGGNGKLGGGLATIATALALSISENTIHIKSGTYTLTTAMSVDGSINLNVIGYGTTHNDGGTKPLITTATDSVILWNYTVAGTGTHLFRNLSMSHTAAVRAKCFYWAAGSFGGNSTYLYVEQCVLDGFTYGVHGPSNNFFFVTVIETEAKNFSIDAFTAYDTVYLYGCYVHGCNTAVSTAHAQIVNSLMYANASGVSLNSKEFTAINSVFANATASGINLTTCSVWLTNCIIYGSANYGIQYIGTIQPATSNIHCAFGSNAWGDIGGSGTPKTFKVTRGQVALTVDPFTNAAGGDFSLNATAGGGAECTETGIPSTFPGGTTTGAMNIGAVQAAGGGGGGGGGGGSLTFVS